MKITVLTAAAAVLLSSQVSAQVQPITPAEITKLSEFASHPRLLDCMAVYKFDFFSAQLGWSIEGEEVSEAEHLHELRVYLNTGKLEIKGAKAKITKDLARHCLAIAQTATEMLALSRAGKPVDEDDEN